MPAGPHHLAGDLVLPEGAAALVLFAHGSGSGRHSARNRKVARALQQAGIATLLFDLLTPEEEQVDLQTRQHRFDIPLLTQRLQDATAWALAESSLRGLAIGYFGASTGAAAALIAAARLGRQIRAVVSRGGRPDLAGPVVLDEVQAPTLFIVGASDPIVVQLNRHACQHLRVEHRLVLVSGATHLFEEPGALERVGEEAAEWFAAHLARREQHA